MLMRRSRDDVDVAPTALRQRRGLLSNFLLMRFS